MWLVQERGFAVAMKALQCELPEAGDPGRMWPSVHVHSQSWSAVVQFDTELLCWEDKGNSLWLSLEKELLSRQLPVCGGATSGPTMQSQWMGVLEKT